MGCQFWAAPGPLGRELGVPEDAAIACPDDGPFAVMVPVPGGAVCVRACESHALLLAAAHGTVVR